MFKYGRHYIPLLNIQTACGLLFLIHHFQTRCHMINGIYMCLFLCIPEADTGSQNHKNLNEMLAYCHLLFSRKLVLGQLPIIL